MGLLTILAKIVSVNSVTPNWSGMRVNTNWKKKKWVGRKQK